MQTTLRCQRNWLSAWTGGLALAVSAACAHCVWADNDDRGRRWKHPSTDVRVQVNIGAPAVPVIAGEAAYIVDNRGPIHEAFAEPVVFDPSAGLVVSTVPPEPIDEVPPDRSPQADDVVWIPGYWAADEDRSSFVWVSGIWRNMPPGRQFVPGYWREVPDGHQWVSGFWQARDVETVQYLPPPPESIEAGPVGIAPQPNYIWTPGVWMWREASYVWRPGRWIAPNDNWVWVPDHYTWTPSGYVFLSGYWDHVVPRRGVLFAPIHVQPVALAQRTFVYSPDVVVDVSLLVGDLFARPRYGHLYFGDYYDRAYFRSGIYPVVSFHNSRYGYDPTFARFVATQRVAPTEFTQRLRDEYHFRRDHPEARPPRTYTALQQLAERRDVDAHLTSQLQMARPLTQTAQRSDLPFRFQSVPRDRTDRYRQTIAQTRQYEDQRKRLETARPVATPIGPTPPRTIRRTEPKAQLSREESVQQPSRAMIASPPQQRDSGPPAQKTPRVVTPAQPSTPATVQRSAGQATELRLQRSPLNSRPRTLLEAFKNPPAQPKASKLDRSVKPGTRSANRREPQE